MTRRALLALLATLPAAAHAEGADLAPPPGAALPLELMLHDASGPLRLGDALGGLPTLFAFVDYDCVALCGTAIGLAAAMLPGTGLVPGRDYRLVLLGLDADDGPAAAEAMRRAWLGEQGALAGTARLLLGPAASIEAATRALGFRAVRRGAGFDHPLALFVLRPDGRLFAALPALGVEPETLRDALRQAAAGTAPGLFERVQLLCSGITSGRADMVEAVLATCGAATIGLLAGGILLLRRMERRA